MPSVPFARSAEFYYRLWCSHRHHRQHKQQQQQHFTPSRRSSSEHRAPDRVCYRLALLAAVSTCCTAVVCCLLLTDSVISPSSSLMIASLPAVVDDRPAAANMALDARRRIVSGRPRDDVDRARQTRAVWSSSPGRRLAESVERTAVDNRGVGRRPGVETPSRRRSSSDRYGHYSARLSPRRSVGWRGVERDDYSSSAPAAATAATIDGDEALREMKFRRQRSAAPPATSSSSPAEKKKKTEKWTWRRQRRRRDEKALAAAPSPTNKSNETQTGNGRRRIMPLSHVNATVASSSSEAAGDNGRPSPVKSGDRRATTSGAAAGDERNGNELTDDAAGQTAAPQGETEEDEEGTIGPLAADRPPRHNPTTEVASAAAGAAVSHPLTVDPLKPDGAALHDGRRQFDDDGGERKINGQFIRRPTTVLAATAIAEPTALATASTQSAAAGRQRRIENSADRSSSAADKNGFGRQHHDHDASIDNRSPSLLRADSSWRQTAELSNRANDTASVETPVVSGFVSAADEKSVVTDRDSSTRSSNDVDDVTSRPEATARSSPTTTKFNWSDVLLGENDVNMTSSGVIPSILHQTWDDVFVPGQVVDWIRSWTRLNPDYDTWFWTDSGARRLLQQSTTTGSSALAADLARLAGLYDAYPHAIHRADVRKYLALYAVGGVVADLDTESVRPLDLAGLVDAAAGRQCVLAREPELHRAFVYGRRDPLATALFAACRPRHPFFRFVVAELLGVYAPNAHRLAWNDNVLNSTGPTFLTDAVRLYRQRRQQRRRPGSDVLLLRPEDDVFVAPADWFAPSIDPLNVDHFRLMCKLSAVGVVPAAAAGTVAVEGGSDGGRRLDDPCMRLRRRQPRPTVVVDDANRTAPYTDHHWLHSWSDRFVARGGLVDVTTVQRLTVLVT